MVNAGRILIMPQGDWSALTNYEMLDLVTKNGVAYLARQASVGVDPATDTSLTYWQPFGTASSIATTTTPGLVMPDGSTITIDNTGLVEVPIDGSSIQIDSNTGKMKAVVDKALSGLTDVNITSAANGQVLEYDSSASKWKNVTLYGTDILTQSGGTSLTSAISVDLDSSGRDAGIVGTDLLDETAIAGITAVSNNNAIEGSLLSAHTAQSDLNHDNFLQMLVI